MPLQRFWIPVHAAITLFVVLALVLTWRDPSVRRLLLIGLGSYIVMRVWSGLYFIPEMLAFQKIPRTPPRQPNSALGFPNGTSGPGSGNLSMLWRFCVFRWPSTK